MQTAEVKGGRRCVYELPHDEVKSDMDQSQKPTPRVLRCYGGPLDGETRVLKYGTSLIEHGDYVQTGHGKVHRAPSVRYDKREFYRGATVVCVLIASNEEATSFEHSILHKDWDKHDASARYVAINATDL